MANSAYSIIGLAHKWLIAAEKQGCTPEILNKMAEHPTLFGDTLALLEGRATITLNKPLTKVAKAVASVLLALVATTSVAATTMPFIAKDRFVINTKANAKVKICGLGDNFKMHLLEKVEEPFSGSELHVHRLVKNSKDKPVIDELGGEAKAETTLTEMFALMEIQGRGQKGVLLTNGFGNIFYIRDVNGLLWAVDCGWGGGGWGCGANSVEGRYDWDTGRQVISRNSVPM